MHNHNSVKYERGSDGGGWSTERADIDTVPVKVASVAL